MLFPAPFSPTSAISSPLRMCRFNPATAGSVPPGIRECDIVELDSGDRATSGSRLRLGRHGHQRPDRQERKVVVEKRRVLIDRDERARDLPQRPRDRR